MKDAFGKQIKLGDKVIYSVSGGGGTEYVIGTVSKLYPYKKSDKSYTPPDRVSINPIRTTRSLDFSKEPIIYAANVVVLSQID